MSVHIVRCSNVETTKNNPETAPTSKDDAIESSSKTETGTSVSESANSNPAEGGDTKGTASKRKAQSADDDDDDKVDPELAAYVLITARIPKEWGRYCRPLKMKKNSSL